MTSIETLPPELRLEILLNAADDRPETLLNLSLSSRALFLTFTDFRRELFQRSFKAHAGKYYSPAIELARSGFAQGILKDMRYPIPALGPGGNTDLVSTLEDAFFIHLTATRFARFIYSSYNVMRAKAVPREPGPAEHKDWILRIIYAWAIRDIGSSRHRYDRVIPIRFSDILKIELEDGQHRRRIVAGFFIQLTFCAENDRLECPRKRIRQEHDHLPWKVLHRLCNRRLILDIERMTAFHYATQRKYWWFFMRYFNIWDRDWEVWEVVDHNLMEKIYRPRDEEEKRVTRECLDRLVELNERWWKEKEVGTMARAVMELYGGGWEGLG